MHIIELVGVNVKRIKAIRVVPKGPVIQITGKNGSGKSSCLDLIFMALGGANAIPEQPLRRGAKSGRARLDLGDFIVERVFRESGTTELTVRDGTKRQPGQKDSQLPKYGSPQELLDGLLGRMTFDPLAFSRMKPREQFEELRSIAKVSVDIDRLEKANDIDFANRTRLNADAKQLRARAAGFAFKHAEAAAPINVGDLARELEQAFEHNGNIDRRIERRAEVGSQIELARAEVSSAEAAFQPKVKEMNEELERAIAALRGRHAQVVQELRAAIDNKKKKVEDLQAKLDTAPELPAKIDVIPIRQKIDQARELNQEFDNRRQQKQLIGDAEKAEARAAALTEQMAARANQKKEALQNSEMPVPGLALDGGIVTFNDLPFDQASDAERLRVSVAIAMAGNPEIRVMRIKEGGLLDDDGMKILEEMAKEKDWQIWLELVHGAGPMAVVMVDGAVEEQASLEPVSENAETAE